MKVFSPIGERNQGVFKDHLAPRPSDLKGKIVGILDNRAGKAYFDRIQELLKAKCQVAKVMRWVKPEQVKPASNEMIAEVARVCNVVIAGTGV
jgi:hypothetical protein